MLGSFIDANLRSQSAVLRRREVLGGVVANDDMSAANDDSADAALAA